jgi:adenine C2-methylase RlmN of 23S rRNA A2503 and tRNA A37
MPAQDTRRFSIVLMGRARLQNYDNVMKAIHSARRSRAPRAASRITLSTAGLVPGMERLRANRFPESSIS